MKICSRVLIQGAALLSVASGFSPSARADEGNVVCEGHGSFGKLRLTVGNDGTALLESLDEAGLTRGQKTFSSLQWVWDGHRSGMATTRSFSFTYHDDFGCIHEASMTTDTRFPGGFIETVKLGSCRGGSTPDDVCFGTH